MRKNQHKSNNIIKNVYDAIQCRIHSSILCIKYPFLYTRYISNDLHYTSYKIEEKLDNIRKKLEDFYNEKENGYKVPKIKKFLNIIQYKILKFHYYYTLQIIHGIPNDTLLDDMEPGWRKAFGLQMCEEIKQALLESGGRKMLNDYRILQLKEKWGSVRWYDNGAPSKVHEIINSYELISYYTCGNCGQPAKYHTRPWVYPLCEQCITEKAKEKAIEITNNNSNVI